jgi:hypothetical protein
VLAQALVTACSVRPSEERSSISQSNSLWSPR